MKIQSSLPVWTIAAPVLGWLAIIAKSLLGGEGALSPLMLVVLAACLFAGGFVASQLTTGENKLEAGMYGLLVWALVFAMLLWLMASGVRAGFNAMVGVATAGSAAADAAGQNVSQASFEEAARRAGYDCVLLDTLDDMEAARALYEELGFEDIPPYYHNPIPGAHYLKADLWHSGPAPLSSRF